MEKLVFYSQYVRPPKIYERVDDEDITERAGYISAKKQIENLILAGQRLSDYRKMTYDFSNGQDIPDDYYDPTRSPNYDMADATQDSFTVQARLKKQKEASNEKARIDSSKVPTADGINTGKDNDTSQFGSGMVEKKG